MATSQRKRETVGERRKRQRLAKKQPITEAAYLAAKGDVPEKKKAAKPRKTYEKKTLVSLPANAQTVINISATFDLQSVQLMWLSLFSKIYEKSWNSMTTVPLVYGPSYIQDAFVILQNLTSQYMNGETPAIKELPFWIQVIFNLLGPKNVHFRLQMLKYNWSTQFAPQVLSIIPVYPANEPFFWVFGNPDPMTEGMYNQRIIPFTYLPANTNAANLQLALGLITDLNPDTANVETGKVTLGRNDPSAFARTFSYLGEGNSAAGEAYGECEMETNFVKTWLPAQFSVFEDLDTRVSRSLRPKSGDSCLLTVLPLINGLVMRDFQTPVPMIPKFIDFEEIFWTYVKWLSAAWTQALSVPSTTVLNATLINPLPMSVQTFRIVLRQGLLQALSDQAAVQFLCPKPQNTTADVVFVPFLLSAGTYSAPEFAKLQFPILLAENIKMLKTNALQLSHSKKVKVIHMPVLGAWVGDIWEEDPQIENPVAFTGENLGETPFSMFQIPYGTEEQISLVDGSISSSPPEFANLNSTYYQTAMNMINNLIGLLTNVGGPISSVGGDQGPGLCLLNFTRYLMPLPLSRRSEKKRAFAVVLEHAERMKEMKKKTSKKALTEKHVEVARPGDMNYTRNHGGVETKSGVNPPGGVFDNITLGISSNMDLLQEMQVLLAQLIIPSIRPDATDTKYPQIISQWQIASVEPNYATYNSGGETSIASTFRVDDIDAAVATWVSSITNGQVQSDILKTIVAMSESGKCTDWLGILGGVVGAGLNIASKFM